MSRHFEIGLKNLKDELVSMAGLVERAIEAATTAVPVEGNRLKQVYEWEKQINEAHKNVDESCLKLLASQQPFAMDLRLILAVVKMNSDLERMGDQAVNIAHNLELYAKGTPFQPTINLTEMVRDTRLMVRDAIDAFVKGSTAEAREILKRDDKIDDMKRDIFKQVIAHAKIKSELIEPGLCLILIARNLERIGDHATNIAEDVIFAISGDDIRHLGHQNP